MGSSSHCLFEADLIILVISSTVAGWKQERSAGIEGGPGTWGEHEVKGMADRSLVILSVKKLAKDWAGSTNTIRNSRKIYLYDVTM